MADDDKTKTEKTSDEGPQKPSEVEAAEQTPEIDLDDDLADALGEEGKDAAIADINIDDVIKEADPDFEKELASIDAKDFAEASVNTDAGSADATETEKVPSAFRAFLSNLPKEVKTRYGIAVGIIVVMVPLAALIFMGKVLPTFELPYIVSMNELTKKVTVYPTDGVEVPLFDEFRSNSFTYALPKTTITLKNTGEGSSYGEFEFFLNLRDKDLADQIDLKKSEIIDLIQRTLEEVSWRDLQTPIGKERVKKIIRHRVNEYLQGNLVLGVFYRSVVLSK